MRVNCPYKTNKSTFYGQIIAVQKKKQISHIRAVLWTTEVYNKPRAHTYTTTPV